MDQSALPQQWMPANSSQLMDGVADFIQFLRYDGRRHGTEGGANDSRPAHQ